MGKKSLEVNIEPKILKWARESIGKTVGEVAKKIKVDQDTINKWESGEKNPTKIQLEKLSNIYKRPIAVFFLSQPPKGLPLPRDFRTLPNERRETFSSDILLAIRRARRLQSLTLELTKNLSKELSLKIGKASLTDNPEKLAEKERDRLGIKVETQFEWKDEKYALKNWQKSIEILGILVSQMGLKLEEARAFSLLDNSLPVIVLNSRDSIRGRIFSLFHEYGHILLNNAGICDMKEQNDYSYQGMEIEKFCNHFAGTFLVPKNELLNHELVISRGYQETWPDDDLEELGKYFKVSREVILRRLLIIGRCSNKFYKLRHRQWKEEIFKQPRFARRLHPARKCIQENGTPFTSLVVESYKAERITYKDAADYLSTRVRYLENIENLVTPAIAT